MAPWIPSSCCCNREPSLRLIGDGDIPTAAEADRLFPKCLVTILKLPTLLLCDRFTVAVTGEDNGVTELENFDFSFCLFDTLIYRGFISFKYLGTDCFGLATVEVSSEDSFVNLLLKLLSLVKHGETAASDLHFTEKRLLCSFLDDLENRVDGLTGNSSPDSLFPAFLNPSMNTLNIGPDFSNEIGDDKSFESDSIDKFFSVMKTSLGDSTK